MNNNLFYYNPAAIPTDNRVLEADLCIYGANAAGCIAAIQAKKMGLSVVLLEPSGWLGGLTTGGLSFTDYGKQHVIGGLSREFYKRCGTVYRQDNEEWKFEPKVATQVFHSWLEEFGIEPLFRRFVHKVQMDGKRISAISLQGGLQVRAKVFMDCSYEGDLMARAGVGYHVGRESNDTYNETLNGAQEHKAHQYDFAVSPFIVENDETSGLLPGIEETEFVEGQGDKRVQAYNFRMCLSRDKANQIPFEKPEGYDPLRYVLLARYLRDGWDEYMRKYDPIRGDKCDMNNHGAVSTDFIGQNFDYPDGCYESREKIFQAHVTYQKGLMWFRSNSPDVPADVQEKFREWALPADEFLQTGGWPQQLYIREARRMISEYVMTEHDCRGDRVCDDPVGMGSYNIDSHNCRRFLRTVNGKVQVRNEGDVQVGIPPYSISRRSIEPKKSECENLLVPVCAAASHIAYGSIRMEPVFMILGQSASTLAALSLQNANAAAVQDVPYADLRKILLDEKQVLELK